MTVEETIRDDLYELGLKNGMVNEIMPVIKNRLIGTKMGDNISCYPKMYIHVSINAARCTTRRWLQQNHPCHFAIAALS